MPELPEVEAVRRRLRERAAGHTISAARIERARTTFPLSPRTVARKIAGRRIVGVTRRAKNILLQLDGGATLRIHLGMTGNLWVDDPANRLPGMRAWFSLDDGREIVFADPRLFGRIEVLDEAGLADLESSLGVEPLSPAFTLDYLIATASKSRKPAKVFLLDQRYIAGLGNIWAAESLFAARIDPRAPMATLTRAKIARLHVAIRDVLTAAVKSAYRKYSAPRQTPESDGFGVAVYNRFNQPCLRCGRRIQRIVLGGRSTYFCPRCQA